MQRQRITTRSNLVKWVRSWWPHRQAFVSVLFSCTDQLTWTANQRDYCDWWPGVSEPLFALKKSNTAAVTMARLAILYIYFFFQTGSKQLSLAINYYTYNSYIRSHGANWKGNFGYIVYLCAFFLFFCAVTLIWIDMRFTPLVQYQRQLDQSSTHTSG